MTLVAGAVSAADVEELRSTFRGEVIAPDDAGYDDPPQDLERLDRPTAGLIARCTGQADVADGRPFRTGPRAADRGPRRRSQLPRAVDVRRRAAHRSRPDERGPRRSRSPHRSSTSGRAARRARSRDAGARAGGAVGHRHAHRHRRPHARRRHRMDPSEVRTHDRQPGVRRPRHRRRRAREGECRREPRPLLGRARRGRQLRDRDVLRVRVAARRTGARRPDLLAREGRAGGAAVLPGLHHHRSGRVHVARRPPAGARAPDRPAGPGRQAGRRCRLVLVRRPRRGRARPAAVEVVRVTRPRRLRAQAVPRPSGVLRSVVRAGLALLRPVV